MIINVHERKRAKIEISTIKYNRHTQRMQGIVYLSQQRYRPRKKKKQRCFYYNRHDYCSQMFCHFDHFSTAINMCACVTYYRMPGSDIKVLNDINEEDGIVKIGLA